MIFKLFNFIFYMHAAAASYFNIYFREIGFSSAQIGLINAIPRGITLLFLPVWGILSDYLQANKKLMIIAITGTIIFCLAFMTTVNYYYIIIIMIVFLIFQNPILPLSDALLLTYLSKNSLQYGRYRVWGSFGYILVVSLFGYYIEKTEPANAFYLFALVLVLTLLITVKLPEGKRKIQVSNLKNFRVLLQKPELAMFLVYTFFIQFTLMSSYTFFPLYIVDYIGRETVFGLALTIAAVSEILIFIYSEKIFKKFTFKYIFLISSLAFTIRWFLMYRFPFVTAVLLIQLLHSLTFGLFHVTAVNFINDLSGEKFQATGQNLYAATAGLSAIVGNYISGIIYETMGGLKLYLIWSLITLIMGIIYFAILNKRSKQIVTG